MPKDWRIKISNQEPPKHKQNGIEKTTTLGFPTKTLITNKTSSKTFFTKRCQ